VRSKSFSKERSFSKQLVLSSEKRLGQQTCYKSEESKYLHPLHSLQDGRVTSTEGNAQRGGLSLQNRSQRCIFFGPSVSETPKIYMFPMRRSTLRIPLSLFWPGVGTRIFTKLLKIPISILRRLNIRIIIYLDDMLLMRSTIEGFHMAKDTLIFLYKC